ncbi:MAG: DUF1294 domain-containing protein [Paludibacteraceae bacterium]|nr:DUF1294 domain-containing protein [Paludibacteraceae bacterium]
MDKEIKLLAIYITIVNLAAFITYSIDKWKARSNQRRVPEDSLLWLAWLGGGIGALLAMLIFRHKTKHKKFLILVPLAIVVYAAGFIYLAYIIFSAE